MEKIDKIIEILQAFKEGKRIEWYADEFSKWESFNGNLGCLLMKFLDYDMRIKQPTYRPYANTEEFIKASKEHGPYIVDCYAFLALKVYVDAIVIDLQTDERGFEKMISFDDLVKYYWQDGTPCGVLE